MSRPANTKRPITHGTCRDCGRENQTLIETCTKQEDRVKTYTPVCRECSDGYAKAEAIREAKVKLLISGVTSRRLRESARRERRSFSGPRGSRGRW
jgi:hypothetical protein